MKKRTTTDPAVYPHNAQEEQLPVRIFLEVTPYEYP